MNSYIFNMPDIGEGVVEGEVVSWLKKEGDAVKKDEPVLVLMTDKATVELPTPYAGVIAKTYYKQGDIAKKGTPLFEVAIDAVVAEQPSKALASPAVRQLAKDKHIDIQTVKGSGPLGRVLKADLEGQADEITVPLTGIRRLMAKKMEESHERIPPFSYFEAADASRLVDLREKMLKEAQKRGLKLTFMPFFIKALSLTIQEHPLVNSSLDEEKEAIIEHNVHNIGIAMKTAQGLIVPVLKGVEKMDLEGITQAYETLKQRALQNQLTPSDMKEGTITITNFGALSEGADYATPIINYPEVAILGVAHIHKEPVVRGNAVTVGQVLHCSWSFDHRVIDGEEAAKISNGFIKKLENPACLLR